MLSHDACCALVYLWTVRPPIHTPVAYTDRWAGSRRTSGFMDRQSGLLREKPVHGWAHPILWATLWIWCTCPWSGLSRHKPHKLSTRPDLDSATRTSDNCVLPECAFQRPSSPLGHGHSSCPQAASRLTDSGCRAARRTLPNGDSASIPEDPARSCMMVVCRYWSYDVMGRS